MKTRFDSLLKIKKQSMQEKELEIAKLNSLIHKKLDEARECQEEMRAFLTPSAGSMQDFKMLAEYKQAFLFQIDSIHLEISELKNERSKYEEAYRLASIEYEKTKYLQENERKKLLLALKRQEEKNIDEIASIRFSLQKEPS